jgi:hypothetical protein
MVADKPRYNQHHVGCNPERYGNPDGSGLTAEVTPAQTDYNFELTSR